MNLYARGRVLGYMGPRFKGKRIDGIVFGFPTDSFPLKICSRLPYHVTVLQGPRRRRGSRATTAQQYCGGIFFFFMTTDLCDVITPPCLKSFGFLIWIDLTGEVSRSVHGGLNTQSRKSQFGWGKKLLLIFPSNVSDGTVDDALRVMSLYQ